MSGSLNKVTLIGNLGKEPETRTTPDGGRIGSFSIATSEYWKDKTTGERRDKTEWHRIVVFNEKLIDVAERFLKKGSAVYIEGQLQTRKWTDKEGHERYTTEIVLGRFQGQITLLDSRSANNEDSQNTQYDSSFSTPTSNTPTQTHPWQSTSTAQILNDDIPF
jgi:single-strand DNA-binding protein